MFERRTATTRRPSTSCPTATARRPSEHGSWTCSVQDALGTGPNCLPGRRERPGL